MGYRINDFERSYELKTDKIENSFSIQKNGTKMTYTGIMSDIIYNGTELIADVKLVKIQELGFLKRSIGFLHDFSVIWESDAGQHSVISSGELNKSYRRDIRNTLGKKGVIISTVLLSEIFDPLDQQMLQIYRGLPKFT